MRIIRVGKKIGKVNIWDKGPWTEHRKRPNGENIHAVPPWLELDSIGWGTMVVQATLLASGIVHRYIALLKLDREKETRMWCGFFEEVQASRLGRVTMGAISFLQAEGGLDCDGKLGKGTRRLLHEQYRADVDAFTIRYEDRDVATTRWVAGGRCFSWPPVNDEIDEFELVVEEDR